MMKIVGDPEVNVRQTIYRKNNMRKKVTKKIVEISNKLKFNAE